jgi:methionyl-tRNA formyltransferase
MTRAVFFGTPAAAVPALAALATVAEVSLVVTRPDRPRGRSGRPEPPPVKEAARAWGLPVSQPERAGEAIERIGRLEPDVAVVTAFGQLLPTALLAVPRRGFVNVHFSVLPRWRGASPVVRAILAGDAETGVTLMQIDEGLDTGPILGVRATAIREGETAGLLTARLAGLGAGLLAESLDAIVSGELLPRPQSDEGATAAGRVRIEEAYVDPARHGAAAVLRAVRAFDPRPGAWSTAGGVRLKLWGAATATEEGIEAGTAILMGDRVLLGARDGVVELLEVQPAGKPRMRAADWMRGRRGGSIRLGS